MPDLLKAAGILVLAQTYILSGIFFISGRLLPNTLAGVYETLDNSFLRTVAAAILVLPLGNFGLAYAYQHYNPAHSVPMGIAIGVLVAVVFTFFIVQAKPQWLLIPAIILMVCSCVWVSLLLNQKA